MYKVHLLPASFGDSILIEYGEESLHYILIDGGPYYAFDNIIAAIKKIAPDLRELELLVVTHVDIDHIDGIITMVNQTNLPFKIKEIWFNGYDAILKLLGSDMLGGLQGEYLSRLINKKKIPSNLCFKGEAICIKDYSSPPTIELAENMFLTVLGPSVRDLVELIPAWDKHIEEIGGSKAIDDKWMNDHRYQDQNKLPADILGSGPDTSPANRSSIAFLASYQGKTCLFAGDSTTACLLKSIDSILAVSGETKLKLDAWKLSHHGSNKSTRVELMKKIETNKILVSSDGKRYKHPDEECIRNLIDHSGTDLNFYFNYRSDYNQVWEDRSGDGDKRYKVHYPAEQDGPGITAVL